MAAAAGGLVALMAVIAVGSAFTSDAASDAAGAVRTATAYHHAATAVAAEESLERKYRLQPGPVPKADHSAAETSLVQAMGQVAVLGGAADRQLAKVVIGEHDAYVAASSRLFASVDRGDPMSVTNTIDSSSVDPVFGAMEAQVYDAASAHEAAALNSVASLRRAGH